MPEATEKIVAVPRIFVKRVIAGGVDAAKKEGITPITSDFINNVRDKRNTEKGK